MSSLKYSSIITNSVGHKYRYSNTIREYLNRPIILDYSNIRVLPEYYSNTTCNVTCSAKAPLVRVFNLLFLSTTINITINITTRSISIINIIVKFISVINLIAKMSESSLSPPPMSEPSLPIVTARTECYSIEVEGSSVDCTIRRY